jgi:hypothetical protein
MRRLERYYKLCGTVVLAATAFLGAAAVGSGFVRAASIPAMNLSEAITCIVFGFVIFMFAVVAVYDQIRVGGDRRARQKEVYTMIKSVVDGKFAVEM